MIVGVFEVYSAIGYSCLAFLTEEEAKAQTILSPSEGPFSANIEMTEDEYKELQIERYMWVS